MGIVAWVVLGLAAAILLLAFHPLTRMGTCWPRSPAARLGAPVNGPGTLSRMAPARFGTGPQPEWDDQHA